MTQESVLREAKASLDRLIGKQRLALYKPIQIAEILHQVRKGKLSIDDVRYRLETYRNPSKRWRDAVTTLLINQISTSSQKYQDNLFEPNAMPPKIIATLAEHNDVFDGVVERYIYQQFARKQSAIFDLMSLLTVAKPDEFSLKKFLSFFVAKKGVRRSIDKSYEIVVYALFNTLVRHLKINVKVQIDEPQSELLKEFEDFTQILIGIDSKTTSVVFPARLFRAGVTNAADRGLDMWSNFGPAVQVKHLSLSSELAEDVSDSIGADSIVIVCKDAEAKVIYNVCNQLGMSKRIRGVITENDLIGWYDKALKGKFSHLLAEDLLLSLKAEFLNEFPYSETFEDFFRDRGYPLICCPESPFYQETGWQ